MINLTVRTECVGCSGVGEADLKPPPAVTRITDDIQFLSPADHALQIIKEIRPDLLGVEKIRYKDPGSPVYEGQLGFVFQENGADVDKSDFVMKVERYTGQDNKNIMKSCDSFKTLEGASLAFAQLILNEPHGSVSRSNDEFRSAKLMFVSEKLFACVFSAGLQGEDLAIALCESKLK